MRESRLKTRERAIAYGLNTKIDTDGRIISDEDKNVSADIPQKDTEPQEAAPETPAREVLPPVEGLRGKEKTQDQTKLNFHYNLWETEKGGAKTRYQWNIDAICTLKQIEAENRLATQEEQTVLSKFVGWGGLSQAFDENNAAWSKEYAELKELLSDEEYSAARATVNNAFYTSPEIATCINSALVQFGFKGGNVLEPSMGIGNFFGSMPAPMQQSRLYGVELDSISGRIAKQLYQNANISITGFENTTYPDNFFDVVMGNVPFGDYKGNFGVTIKVYGYGSDTTTFDGRSISWIHQEPFIISGTGADGFYYTYDCGSITQAGSYRFNTTFRSTNFPNTTRSFSTVFTFSAN